MANLRKIVYLDNKEQFEQLIAGQTVTLASGTSVTFNEADDYRVPEGDIIDIGSLQLELEADGKIYPKMTIANAKLIYSKYKAGKAFTIKWTLSGISLFFHPVNATTMTNSFIVVLHDKFIKYEWTNDQADNAEISPKYEEEQTWTHTINCDATTAQGVYKYQFQFRDNDAAQYSMLYEVAEHLNEEYSGIRLPASGTYKENNDVYIVNGVQAYSESQIEVFMTKLSDGSDRSITTGAVAVSDSIHK